jgi:hypothetical protein
VEPPVGGQAYGGTYVCSCTKQVPCTAAATDAPCTPVVSAVDDVDDSANDSESNRVPRVLLTVS